jgi:hypothetical protein
MTPKISLPLGERPLDGGQPPDRLASPGGSAVWVNYGDPALIGGRRLHPAG